MAGWDELGTGTLVEARARCWAEIAAAEERGDAERLARAALGLGGVWLHEHRSMLDRTRVRVLQERALALVGATTPLGRRLRLRLRAEAAYVDGDHAALLAGLDEARLLGDPNELAEALSLTHHCMLGPDHALDRLALAEELIAVAPDTGRPLDVTMGLLWRTVDLFLTGDRRASRALSELRTHLDRHPCPPVQFVVAAIDVMLATRAGRLAEAEQLAADCFELGKAVGDADALGWYGAQLVAIRWMQGRGEDVLDLLTDLASSPSVGEHTTAFDAAIAAVASACGEHGVAASALAALGIAGLGTRPTSSAWLATMHAAAEAAHLLDDRAVAAQVAAALGPHAELPVMPSLAVSCLGSTHRPLGVAALTMGDVDGAIEHLTAAVAADLALGNLPCAAIDRATLAGALQRRGGPGDSGAAAELLATAIADGERFGMTARATRWRQALRHGQAEDVACARDGRLWVFSIGPVQAMVRDSVGVRHVATLLANPGVEVPALQLVGGQRPGGVRPAQPLLDEAAKHAYRRQLQDLQEELDDAEACADLGRASHARRALDQLVDALTAATGLGGRDRCFADDAERARVAVQKAIKRALMDVTAANPEIGRVLAARLGTGARCVYRAA